MFSFGPYAGKKMLSPSIALSIMLHSVEGRAKCPTVPQRRELVTGRRAAGQGSINTLVK